MTSTGCVVSHKWQFNEQSTGCVAQLSLVEKPLESDPIVVLIIDPPPSFNSSKKQKQAEVTKNHSSLLSIQVFPFS